MQAVALLPLAAPLPILTGALPPSPPPASKPFSHISFDQKRDAIVFLHIPKAGGTTFNQRLTTLETDPPCVALQTGHGPGWHNGHANVEVDSCACGRWSLPGDARPAPVPAQWLISPVTTGWLNGVHTPLRFLEAGVAQHDPQRAPPNVHFVTMLREPLARTISEFYETYDGWEHVFHTPYRPARAPGTAPSIKPLTRCSESLPAGSVTNIDGTSKAVYDAYFPRWLRCQANMAVGRQTRVLGLPLNADSPQVEAICGGAEAVSQAIGSEPFGSSGVSGGEAAEGECAYRLAAWTLEHSVSFFGLSEERCLSERLFTAMFGLRFTDHLGLGAAPTQGKGAHRVEKLRFVQLNSTDQLLLRERNRHDLRLYSLARNIFEARLKAFGVSREGCFRRRRRLHGAPAGDGGAGNATADGDELAVEAESDDD